MGRWTGSPAADGRQPVSAGREDAALTAPESAADRLRRDEDAALMHAVAAGDRGAFATLIARQSPRLLRFVAAMLGSVNEAEETVQEALLRLWQNADAWRPDGLVSTWLHRVAYRLAIDALRRRRPSVAIDGLEDALSDGAPAHDVRMVADEEAGALHRAIAGLPERQRTALVLCHFQEMRQAEAAAVMGLSEHAYESLLARARRRLRDVMAGSGLGGGNFR